MTVEKQSISSTNLPKDKPIRLLILGAGDRGSTYAKYADAHPDQAVVTGVADLIRKRVDRIADRWNLPESARYDSWEAALKNPPEADVVVVSLPDALHEAPALQALAAGYHLLLEKPIARDFDACLAIQKAAHKAKRLVIVGHVLRYTVYFSEIYKRIRSGEIGDVVSIQHIEPVSYMHAAHSFCRGNWGNTVRSTPMILQKCCHDFDQFVWWLGGDVKCKAVSSFGSLVHFKSENAPKGSTARCINCPKEIERDCPFSAIKIYRERTEYRYAFTDRTSEGIEHELAEGPYGRCVYRCDNDAVDHQVVNLLFENGVTVSHVMESYTYHGGRETRICGTRGEICGNGKTLTISHFPTRKVEQWSAALEAGAAEASGHGGGDFGLMRELIRALREDTPEQWAATFDASLESHRIAFAAEASRLREGEVIRL